MKTTFYIIFFNLIITTCSCQNTKVVEVTIINRSSSKIDSVIFPLTNIKWGKIEPGNSKMENIDVSQMESGRKGMLPLLIYQGSKKTVWSWGLHEFGEFPDKEIFYVFDNGINTKDEPIKAPQLLTIFLKNNSESKIDSIVSKSLKTYKVNPNYYEMEFTFTDFQKDPIFTIYQNQTPIKVLVEHDWNNWNNTQEILYLYNNGIVSKKDSL